MEKRISHREYREINKILRWSTWLLIAESVGAGGIVFWFVTLFKK